MFAICLHRICEKILSMQISATSTLIYDLPVFDGRFVYVGDHRRRLHLFLRRIIEIASIASEIKTREKRYSNFLSKLTTVRLNLSSKN